MANANQHLSPLTEAEAATARDFFDGPGGEERAQRFIGWMVASGKYSGKTADDIRQFMAKETRPVAPSLGLRMTR